jgi:hypothetical protein
LTASNSFGSLSVNKVASIDYGEDISTLAVADNDLWIGTKDSGVIKVNKFSLDFNKSQDFTQSNGLVSNNVNNIESAFGKVFVATDLGISIISGENITSHKEIKGIDLTNCLTASNGTIVLIIGNNKNGGVIKYDNKDFQIVSFYEHELSNIAATLVSKDESWIITNNAVIYKISNKLLDDMADWETIEPEKGLFKEPYKIKKIAFDDRDVLWITTENNLFYYDGRKYKKENVAFLYNAAISDILVSQAGFKYISTSKGIVVYVNSRMRKIDKKNGLSNNNTTAVASSVDKLFISTGNSIDLFMLSSLEEDGVKCLSCHTTGKNGRKYEEVDGEFLTVGAILENENVKSGHEIIYDPGWDLSLPASNECIKCHGRLHADDNAIVINVDTGMAYPKGAGNREFCLSCHDFSFEDEEAQVSAHQLKYIVPKNVAEYYNVNGHGANASLSEGKAIISNRDCSSCHTHHSSRNAALIMNEVEYPLTDDEVFNAAKRDAFCKNMCHNIVNNGAVRPVRDHTWEMNKDENRDHTGCPKQPCDTHPSNSPIPKIGFFKYPSKSLPLSGFDPVDELNSGYIVCSTCHDVHGSTPQDESNDDKQMVRQEWTMYDTLCIECHT